MPDPIAMSELLDRLDQIHEHRVVPTGRRGGVQYACSVCRGSWPCATSQLVARARGQR